MSKMSELDSDRQRIERLTDVVRPPTFAETANAGAAPKVKISKRERSVLMVLVDAGGGGPDRFGYLSFAGIASRGALDPKIIRRSVRSLARKGLAEYCKGLWTEDGDLAGSGYAATQAAIDLFEEEVA